MIINVSMYAPRMPDSVLKCWKYFLKMLLSDPNEPIGEVQQFCVRFKNAEIANEFRLQFEESQSKLLDQPITTPERNDTERISIQRSEETNQKTDKMKKELMFFKDKFKNGEGIEGEIWLFIIISYKYSHIFAPDISFLLNPDWHN